MIKIRKQHNLKYQTQSSSAFDILSIRDYNLQPNEVTIIPTGLYLDTQPNNQYKLILYQFDFIGSCVAIFYAIVLCIPLLLGWKATPLSLMAVAILGIGMTLYGLGRQFKVMTVLPDFQIRSRSGTSLTGIHVANQPGTVDADYPEQIGVILANSSDEVYNIKTGDRIAQGVIGLSITANGVRRAKTIRTSGFGSTGKGEL